MKTKYIFLILSQYHSSPVLEMKIGTEQVVPVKLHSSLWECTNTSQDSVIIFVYLFACVTPKQNYLCSWLIRKLFINKKLISTSIFSCYILFFKGKFFFIQQVLISYQFYTHQCIHVNPNCLIHHTTTTTPPPLSPFGVHTLVLYICVSISALQTSSSVPFF